MRGAFGLQWHLTNRCDQRCRHCYIWRQRSLKGVEEEPTLDQCRRIADDFKSFCHSVDCEPVATLTGGDPMLHPYFWAIVEYVNSLGMRMVVLGNPYHLTAETLGRLKQLGVTSFQLSLDGLEQTHDHFRKSGSFRATLKAVRLINKSGIRSMVMSTVSLANYRDMEELVRACVRHRVGNYAFARYCPTHGDQDQNIPPDEYRKFLARMWAVYQELAEGPTNFSLKDHLFTAFLFEEGLFKPKGTPGVIYEGCNCALRHMTLLANGQVYACRRFDSPIGSIYERSFRELFFSDRMERYRQFTDLEGCGQCELVGYCRGCHAVSAGLTGSFFHKDPQCWRCT
ncbi:MAG: radical SAM protein [Patescibacteria group bacterium]|nr:radical SAM protein [Patescibacteria group bacterium]